MVIIVGNRQSDSSSHPGLQHSTNAIGKYIQKILNNAEFPFMDKKFPLFIEWYLYMYVFIICYCKINLSKIVKICINQWKKFDLKPNYFLSHFSCISQSLIFIWTWWGHVFVFVPKWIMYWKKNFQLPKRKESIVFVFFLLLITQSLSYLFYHFNTFFLLFCLSVLFFSPLPFLSFSLFLCLYNPLSFSLCFAFFVFLSDHLFHTFSSSSCLFSALSFLSFSNHLFLLLFTLFA